MLTISTSSNVWVKLTEEGKTRFQKRRRLKKQEFDDTLRGYAEKNCQPGWYRFMLWELMNIFGSSLFIGCAEVFEGGIISLEKPK